MTDQRIDYLAWGRYDATIEGDTARLLDVAADVTAPVPSCPGWTVADLLEHVAMVYAHKVECMRLGHRPEPWPPDEADTSDPAALLRRATADLLSELRTRDPHEKRYTWWQPDQTNGFWYRRMALEVAVHRVDGELAAGVPTPVAGDVALDGIDEVLQIMLPEIVDDADHTTEHPLDARVRVSAGGRSWTVTASATDIAVATADDTAVGVEITGDPSDVFLWLWGRHEINTLDVSGDAAVAAELRGRLAEDE